MSTFTEINDFVLKHTSAQYFEADLRLYKKHFPNSKLSPELDRAPDFAKKALDERMIWELLSNQDSCIDCILENRGFVRHDGNILPLNKPVTPAKNNQAPADNAAIIDKLLKTNITTAKHNVLKQFVFALKLQDVCANQKKETYQKVLNEFVAPLLHTPAPEAPAPEPDKKKEDRDLNTPK